MLSADVSISRPQFECDPNSVRHILVDLSQTVDHLSTNSAYNTKLLPQSLTDTHTPSHKAGVRCCPRTLSSQGFI